MWSATADAVVVLHLLWILFLVFGAWPGRRWRWVRWVHLGGLLFSVVLTAGGWVCPLTYVEVWLRRRAGQGVYATSFIGHYAEQVVYWSVPRWAVGAGLALVVAATAWAYWGKREERS